MIWINHVLYIVVSKIFPSKSGKEIVPVILKRFQDNLCIIADKTRWLAKNTSCHHVEKSLQKAIG